MIDLTTDELQEIVHCLALAQLESNKQLLAKLKAILDERLEAESLDFEDCLSCKL